ncbi:MAG: 6-phosphofructokinase [Candidatus Orphnella occulta]|nr:6-phosphofructokinase [Candidatus Orphnella occulta]MDP8297696.1 6-phosphofructokinase [Candidatus Orphnella occulta]
MSPAKKIKRIAVLTSGGDCAGMNTALRSVVRTAIYNGIKPFAVMHGYKGLIEDNFVEFNRRSVSNIMNRGGTVIKTARSEEFTTKRGRAKAINNLKKHKIDGLVVIGGNGSFKGAHLLSAESDIRCIGVPGTIDNDINGTDYCIGSITAVGVALDAIDKIRDTVTSLERIFVVEVMGRECGYIAMRVALAGGAEEVLLPEIKPDFKKICQEIKAARKKGKVSWILVVAEGAGHGHKVAHNIEKMTGYETRVIVLGHIQRGGSPNAIDRILASRLGSSAVTSLIEGESDKMVGIIANKVILTGFAEACKKKQEADQNLYSLLKVLEA